MVSTCPSRYSPRRITREPLSRSSTPKPHFSCLRAAPRRNTREKLSHTRTRDTMCVAASRLPGRMLHCAQPLLGIPHPTYYSQNYPPVSAPRCNPFGCSCSPPCNPPRRRLLLFPFFQFGLGGGKRATPSPLFSLHPASPVFYHPRGFLACSGRFSFPPLHLLSLSVSFSLSLPRWPAKGKISIFICFFAGYMPAPPPLAAPRLASRYSVGFFFFLFHSTSTLEFLGLSHPFLGLSLPFRLSAVFVLPLAPALSFFLSAFSLPPPNHPPSYGARCGGRDRYRRCERAR